MKQRIGQINNIPLVIGDEHEITNNEILIEQSKTDPNKIDIKRRINGKLKALTNTQGKTKVVNTKRHKVGMYIHQIRPTTYSSTYTLSNGELFTIPEGTFYCRVTLYNGFHILCPKCLHTVHIQQKTTHTNVHYSYNSYRFPHHTNDDPHNKVEGYREFNDILYIISEDNLSIESIIKVDFRGSEYTIANYPYYLVLIQDNKIISKGVNPKYSLQTYIYDYLNIGHIVEYDNNHIDLQSNGGIFIDNVTGSSDNLNNIIQSEKYFKVLGKYINTNGVLGNLENKLYGIVKKHLGRLKSPNLFFSRGSKGEYKQNYNISTPFFNIEVNQVFVQKEREENI